jgi:hypothetical protein
MTCLTAVCPNHCLTGLIGVAGLDIPNRAEYRGKNPGPEDQTLEKYRKNNFLADFRKSEIRISKSKTNPNLKCLNDKNEFNLVAKIFSLFYVGHLNFSHWNLFRISACPGATTEN